MSYRRTGLGAAAGLPVGYAVTGYCPNTNIPGWVSKPDGTFECMTDAQIQALANVASAAAASAPAALASSTSAGTIPAAAPLLSPVVVSVPASSGSIFDTAIAWVQAYPLLAAGIIGVGAVVLLGKL